MNVSSQVLLVALIIVCLHRKGSKYQIGCDMIATAQSKFSLCVGLGAVNFIDPPSGSVIANFEGTLNAATLTCNVTNEGFQIVTFWTVANFRGVTGTRPVNSLTNQDLFLVGGGSFFNQLTVTNWTSEVDRVTVFCGIGSDLEQANVVLRLYSKFERQVY